MAKLKPYGLWFGLAGGITFTAAWTVSHYMTNQEFTWTGIFGGITWFAASMALHLAVNRQ